MSCQEETYTATTGSTSQGSGTSRFMVRVLDNGIFAKKAFGPFIEESLLLKSSCKLIANYVTKYENSKSRIYLDRRHTMVGITYL